MAIPLTLLNRLAVPLIVAALYLNDQNKSVDLIKQTLEFENTMRLSDQVLSKGQGELDPDPSHKETFDFIVVGGGAAGAVIAEGLSREFTVLLLEAGGDPNPIMDIPFAAGDVFWPTRIMDWNYTTVQQTRSCIHRFNGYCWWVRGKVLGGSSGIYSGLYNRCRPKDYDHWADFTGDSNWSWENLRDTFNQLEDYHGLHDSNENVNITHGKGGDVYVGKIDYLPGLSVLKQALQEKGIPTGDLNSGEFNYGFSTVDYNIKSGMRWGSYRSHIERALIRKTLTIRRYSTATKILFDGNRAIGVEYERHGRNELRVFANKEVIVSGGAMESPKLLMLSGIGPSEHLNSLNISTLIDLPAVGQHLQDHPGIDVLGSDGNGFFLNTTFGTSYRNKQFVLQYLENATGPMNAFSRTPRLMNGYLNSTFNLDKEWPEIYVFLYEKYQEDPSTGEGQEQIYFSVQLMRSTTEGSIKLASANPSDNPLIDPNFFEDPTDVDRIVDGIEIIVNLLMNTTAYQKHGVKMVKPFEPCSRHNEFLSRDYWKCCVYQMTTPRFHTTSTCRMGPNSTVGVVDSKLRVFGTRGLRVVDASVMPFVPSGNTYMPTVLVAQKGLEFILAETNSTQSQLTNQEP